MLVLAIMTGVMMVHVIAAACGEVSRNVPLALEGMLDMDADQRHNAGSLGPQKQPQEERTKAPQLGQRENLKTCRRPLQGRRPRRLARASSISLTDVNCRPHDQRSLAMRNPSV